MDVLQVLNDDYRNLLANFDDPALGGKGEAKRKAFGSLVNRLSQHLFVADEFLQPEVSAVTADIPKPLRDLLDARDEIAELLIEVGKNGGSESFSRLKSVVRDNVEGLRNELLPVMRRKIPTGEREELGEMLRETVEEGYPLLTESFKN